MEAKEHALHTSAASAGLARNEVQGHHHGMFQKVVIFSTK